VYRLIGMKRSKERQLLISRARPADLANIWSMAMDDFASAKSQYLAAEGRLCDALELQTKLLGDKHPDIHTTLSYLAETQMRQGKYKAAESLYRYILAQLRQVLGDTHPEVLITIGKLANVCHSQGMYMDAEAMHQTVLAERRRILGGKHPDT